MSVWITRLKGYLYAKPLVQTWLFPIIVGRYLRRWATAGPKVKGNGLNILILNHCYDQDIEALLRAGNGKETIWVLESGNVFRMVHTFVPAAVSAHNPSNESPEMAPYIARYTREFIEPLADLICKTTHLDVLLAPSDIFFWFRPLIKVLQGRGVRVVVQDKEGTICPSPMMDDHADWIKERFPPIADAYLYWNRRQLELAMKCGVAPGKALILGQPRSDYFFADDRWSTRAELGLPEGVPVVLFFTFGASTYTIEDMDGTAKERPWAGLRVEISDVLERVARRHPDLHVVVKAHPQQPDLWEDFDNWKARGLKNLHFVTGAQGANAFMVRSDVILGFQTTAMIEAMITDKPVIYTGWGAKHVQLLEELLPIPKSGGCDTPRNAVELESVLEQYLNGARPTAVQRTARAEFLRDYFDRADGGASRRVLDFLHETAQPKSRATTPC